MMYATDFFREGGPWMYAILALAVVSLPVGLAAGILHGLRIRVPSAVYVAPLCFLAAVGALGVMSGLTLAEEAARSAADEYKQMMMAQGISISLYTEAFARVVLALLGPLLGLVVAVGYAISVRGERGAWTIAHGGPAAALVGIGFCVSCLLAGLRIAEEHASFVVLWAPFIGICAVALFGLVGARAEVEPERLHGTAGARFTVWVALALAAWGAAGIPEVSGTIVAFKAVATAAPEVKAEMLRFGMEYAQADGRVGLGVLIGVLVAGIPLLAPVAKSVKGNKLALAGLVANLLLVGGTAGVLAMSGGSVIAAMAVATGEMEADAAPDGDPGAETLDLGE